jgi:hypothetical protein
MGSTSQQPQKVEKSKSRKKFWKFEQEHAFLLLVFALLVRHLCVNQNIHNAYRSIGWDPNKRKK